MVQTTAPSLVSDRRKLAFQFRRGNLGLEEDDDSRSYFNPVTFAIGSTRVESRAIKFLSGFKSEAESNSRVAFNFDRRWIYLFIIPLTTATTPPAFIPLEAEVPFEDIVTGGLQLIRREAPDDMLRMTLTTSTRRPARFYTKIKGSPVNLMRRATERDFVYSPGPNQSTQGQVVEEMEARGFIIHEAHAGPLQAVSQDALTVKINSWLTWQFDFILNKDDASRLVNEINHLGLLGKEDGINLLAHKGEQRVKVVPSELIPHTNAQTVLGSMEFRLRYLVEGLVSHGIVLLSEIVELVHALDKHCASTSLKARVLTALFNEERVRHIWPVVMVRARQLKKMRFKVEPHSVWVHKCMITPTRICILPPEQETSNDALRRNNLFIDRFLRVQFTDEDDRIQINPTVKEGDDIDPANGTIARVRRALNAGLSIAGRHYVFLAYGSSSAREHSCWFVAEDKAKGFNAEKIRADLGFSQISEKVVAKHAARMGIPFSATRAITIKVNVRQNRDDIFSPDDLCFTDGVGLCGTEVARQAAKEFGVSSTSIDAFPSAIQIRCGGIKGVLGVWPQLCDPHDVRYRKSQIKFETSRNDMMYGLNVVRTAQFRRAFLNRQFIILLNNLGIGDKTFVDMFTQAVSKVRGLKDRFKNGTATKDDLGAAVGLSEFPIKELYEVGFNQDPVFIDACNILETRMLSDIKWKGRIEVPNSVYLMGIADELGVLKEGEVFCQFRNPVEPGDGPTVVAGTCAVMRAPALHLGDIRVVQAVDHPSLRHLVNVIVFPVVGQRPMPNMLAGGDLDGDDYTLIWEKCLVPKKQSIVEAADYAPPTPVKVNKVTIANVKEFFIDYIRNDILGQVSNAHLAFADKIGPQSDACLTLAHQASIAVDFPKTGVPAVLSMNLRPKTWPTFMGKDLLHTNKSYKSRKILGQLFELVHPDPEFKPSDLRDIPADLRVDHRLASFKLPASIIDDAYKLKEDYDIGVMGLMNRYRITEVEAASGTILKNIKRRRGRDGDLKEPVDQNYRALAHNVLDHAQSFLTKRKFSASFPPLQIYAIAAYQVTFSTEVRVAAEARAGKAEENNGLADLGEKDEAMSVKDDTGSVLKTGVGAPAPLITFPWVFYEHLVALPNVKLK